MSIPLLLCRYWVVSWCGPANVVDADIAHEWPLSALTMCRRDAETVGLVSVQRWLQIRQLELADMGAGGINVDVADFFSRQSESSLDRRIVGWPTWSPEKGSVGGEVLM